MDNIVVTADVSRMIGNLGLDREPLLSVMNRLHFTLPAQADRHRSDRDPENADYFLYRHNVWVRGRWLRIRFGVNDVRRPGYLFVERLRIS